MGAQAPLSKRVKKRREHDKKRREARSAARLAEWKREKDKAAVVFCSEGKSLTDAKIGGGYFGSKSVSARGLNGRIVPYAAG